MSTTTTNYGLIKPDTTDPILIGQLNDNSDAIDAALKENADAIENKPDASDIPSPSTTAPAMDGTGSAGTSDQYARADHVHPSDTSKQDALTTAQLAAVDSGIDSAKVEQIETNKNNISSISTSLDVSQLTLNYVTNSYIDETTFNRIEMRKVAPHIAVFNLNIYNASIGVTSNFVEFGTITGATIAQTAMIQQGNLIIYLQGGTNKLKVYCSSAGTYTLRTSITIVI